MVGATMHAGGGGKLIYEKEEVFMIVLSNVQSFRSYQSKGLLREILEGVEGL